VLAQAVDQHDHTAGKGISVSPANASVTNAKLGPDVARANLLTNGGFEIWQRGAGPFSSGTYCADRWSMWPGGGTLSVSRDTANSDLSGACAVLVVAGGVTVGNAAQVYQAPMVLTDPGADGLRGRTVSVSMRVKCSVATAFRIQASPTVGTPGTSAYHTGGGAYETLTCSATIATNATTTVVTLTTLIEKTGTFYIDNATLVVGSQAADYVPMHPADDLARCLRYYEVIGNAYPYPMLSGYNAAGANTFVSVPLQVLKGVAPTVTKVGTWTVANCAQPTLLGQMLQGFVAVLNPTATGYATAQPNVGQSFTVESNP
jgi:hypothetical protein